MIVNSKITKHSFQDKKTFGQIIKLPEKQEISYEGDLKQDIAMLQRTQSLNNQIDIELHSLNKN